MIGNDYDIVNYCYHSKMYLLYNLHNVFHSLRSANVVIKC